MPTSSLAKDSWLVAGREVKPYNSYARRRSDVRTNFRPNFDV